MQIVCFANTHMTAVIRDELARYRHRVFVQSLQWDMSNQPEIELDEFDIGEAHHLVAYESGEIVGYARLLPTTRPYLLATHFNNLLDGATPPCCPFVWELSRFTASGGAGRTSAWDKERQTVVAKRLLLKAALFSLTRGGSEIIFCTSTAIERLAVRWGVDISRLGRPQATRCGHLLAARIACSRKTLDALKTPNCETRLEEETVPA